MATVGYTVGDNWGSGFIGNMLVPGGTQGLHGWTLEFDAGFDISNIWGAEIVSHVGNHYVIRNAAWNADVAAGGQASLGFQAKPGSGGTSATGFTLNGSASGPAPVPVLPVLSIEDASIAEGDSGNALMTFTVRLSQAASGPVTVGFATGDGTALAGQDYGAATGSITFAAGETVKTITVPVVGDTAVEANETFTVTLSGASGATIGDGSAAGTIVNNDLAPPPAPGGTSLVYHVDNSWGAGFTASMAVGAGGTALHGWTVEFDAGFTIGNIWNATIVSHVGTHYVVRNAGWNGDVAGGQSTAFGFQATTGSGGTTAGGFAINGTAVGAGPAPVAPTLAVADATVVEGNSGVKDLAFTVSLSAPVAGAVTVNYATANGTATAGSDFTASSGTLTFAPGETSKVVHVTVAGDTAVEANETLSLVLSSPSGATLADGSAVGTIVNDDTAPVALPTLAISDASVVEGNPGQGGGGTGAGWFSTSGNQIVDAAGHSVQLAGVNWFGFESSTLAPHGLWTRGYKEMMDQMKELGFNTIRLPFSNDTIHGGTPNGIDFSKNPDLQGLSALQVMDKIVTYAGDLGLRIILDHHRNDSGAGTSGNGLWYDGQHSEAQWISDWQMLASRYAGNPTVVGADLHNEPFAGTWGGGGATDWAAAAERAGNAIGAVNPNWLVFVEGVSNYQGQSYWWGGNLMGVKDRPIHLDVGNKLVYSAHDYPNSIYPQTWFQGSDFPANLPAKFDQMWGYIYKQAIAPVYIGEFGTKLVDPKDAPWLKAITAYISGDLDNNGSHDLPAGKTGASWTYFAWNPNSGDTGGILADDWRTVNPAKMAYLTPIESSLAGAASGGAADMAHLSFLVSLSQPATQAVSVDYHTVPGEAGSADFVAQGGTITFAPGEQSKTITIAVSPDTLDEPDEQFTVALSNPQAATIADGTGVGTIVDDDPSAAPSPAPAQPAVQPAPAAAATLDTHLALADSWSGGFNADVTVHNAGATTAGWQVAIDMPNQITDIWNARIVSHVGNEYVIGAVGWNGTLNHDASATFGFIASGGYGAGAVEVHALGGSAMANPVPAATAGPATAGPADGHVFSPYIDMAMPAAADLMAISHASGITNFTLAFVLGSNAGIGWQGWGTIDQDMLSNGSSILDQVHAVQAAGGDITISFGGAAGTEAALQAASAGQLQAQYQSVIDRYGVHSIDFDIEGAAVVDQHALVLRDQAIVGLQAANPGLEVSFTLPVLPTGLTADGLHLLQQAKADGVHVDVVNIMAMDYGSAVDNGGRMGLSAIQASEATQLQLAGIGIGAKIGITPMIGVNDVASEVFGLADAQALVDYAKADPDVARLSMWSVARDNGGSAGAPYASPDSSGIAQDPYAFAHVFHQYDVL